MSKSSRVLLCDDQEILRSRYRELLGQAPGIEIIGEADGGHASIEMAVALGPDLVLMDVDMPDLNGIEATRRILARRPEIKVLAHSSGSHWEIVREMLSAGASGYLVKGVDPEELVSAIRVLMAGGHYFSGKIQVPVAPRWEREGLSIPKNSHAVSVASAIKVLIVAQTPAVRSKLTRLLSTPRELVVAGETSELVAGYELLRKSQFDVLVWELPIADENAPSLLRVIKQEHASLITVVLAIDAHLQSPAQRGKIGADFLFHNANELERVLELCQMLAHTRWLNTWFANLHQERAKKKTQTSPVRP